MAPGGESGTSAGYYTTSSEPISGEPGPLLRLKSGTDSATPSINGIIARNLVRLGTLLEDDNYRRLARQTCSTFSVELMQHPFLYVNILDAVVGLELGIRNITGVLATDVVATPIQKDAAAETQANKTTADVVRERVRAEAGSGASTSVTTVSMVDVRGSNTSTSTWLQSRNPLFKDLKPGTPPKNYLLICETGSCRMVDV